MDDARRRELAQLALDGYVSGPATPVRATALALAKAAGATAVVLVEGISDQIAVETAAVCAGRSLDAEQVVVVPIGGAHAIGRFLTELGPLRARVRLAGLCDLREAVFRRELHAGLCVCVDDLEDELLRAMGMTRSKVSSTRRATSGSARCRASPLGAVASSRSSYAGSSAAARGASCATPGSWSRRRRPQRHAAAAQRPAHHRPPLK